MNALRAVAIAVLLAFIQPPVAAVNHGAPSAAYDRQDLAADSLISAPDLEVPYSPLRNQGGTTPDAAPVRTSVHTTKVAPWTSSPFSGPAPYSPIPNFGAVEEGSVYRSAQPAEVDYRWLLSQGFTSIVSFRREKKDDREFLLKLGFRNYLWLDIEDETPPTDEQAERFLDFVTDPQNQPVLIHCKVGLGRTGTLAALIRYSIDGWPMEEALEEARLYRNGVDLVPGQVEWLRRWAAKHPPACHRPIDPTQLTPN